MKTAGAIARLDVHIALASLLLLPFAAMFWHSLSGDASIYFTFIRHFFQRPFSYQPGMVSFGATSPLHVVLHAPIFRLFGPAYWLAVSRAINLLFIAVGVALVNRAIGGHLTTLLLACALTAVNTDLWVSTAQFFETGLTFLAMAALYYTVTRRQVTAAAGLCGLLYLIRPELIVVGALVATMLIVRGEPSGRSWSGMAGIAILLIVPALAYHVYMWHATGAWVPSSVFARAVTSMESDVPWPSRLAMSVRAIADADGLFYAIGGLAVAAVVAGRRIHEYALEIAMLAVVAVYVIAPPLGYTPRYLLPVAPIVVAIVLRLCSSAANLARRKLSPARVRVAAVGVNLVALCLLAATAASAYPYSVHPRYDYDTLLLKDLAEVMNPITTGRDEVLMYEIQAQYHLHARCLSLDGIVGNQLLDALTRRESFEHFIQTDRDVAYVVTANAFNTRKIYARTILARLYTHDLHSDVGAVLESGTLRFRKIVSNPVFSEERYHRDAPLTSFNESPTIRVYAAWNPLWADHSPLWNSVYRIER